MDRTGTGSCPMAGLVLAVLNMRAVLPASWLICELIGKNAVEHNYINCIIIFC